MIYDDREFVTDRERKIARWLALGMHAAFVVLLIFGVAWQKRYSEPAAIVDLWSTMAPPKAEPPRPVPRPEPVIEPRPEPKVERKPEPRPAPKPEVKREPKPDIALREKLEKERKAQEELEKKKQAELKKKEDEAKKLKAAAEAKKKEEVAAKERLLKEEMDSKRLAQEKADMAAKRAKEQAAAAQGVIDKYKRLINDHIKRRIVEPQNLQGNPQVEFDVILIPGGEVLSVKLRRSSGIPAYDAAVERAILGASPLPLPADATLFQQFRELDLKFRPK